jgi:hypothetical protein
MDFEITRNLRRNSQEFAATFRTPGLDTSAFSTPFNTGRCLRPAAFLPLMFK